MGLDAVVYRRLEEIPLPKDADLDLIRVDEATGEVYFCGDKPQLEKADVRAVHKRLGNMALISSLHDQISRALSLKVGPSVLLDKVLYNGTHGADVIAADQNRGQTGRFLIFCLRYGAFGSGRGERCSASCDAARQCATVHVEHGCGPSGVSGLTPPLSRLHSLSVLGYCLMSNHVHLVTIPAKSESLAAALKETHGRYASYWNAKHTSSGHLWQGRAGGPAFEVVLSET